MVLALGEFDFACSLVRLSLADKKVMAEATQLRLLLITLILVVSWCDGIGIGRRLKFRTCPDRACHNKIDKICRRSESPSCYCCGGHTTSIESGTVCSRYCLKVNKDEEPCSLISEFAPDLDSLPWPYIPTLTPLRHITCGPDNITLDQFMRQPQEDTTLSNNASKIDGNNAVLTNDDSSFNNTVIQEEVTSDGPVSTTTTLHSNSEFPNQDSS